MTKKTIIRILTDDDIIETATNKSINEFFKDLFDSKWGCEAWAFIDENGKLITDLSQPVSNFNEIKVIPNPVGGIAEDKLIEIRKGKQKNLCGADLRDADLCGADLRGADLRGADLRSAYLRDADLRGADLCGADLRDANLRGVDLRGANLRGVDLCDANLRGADLCDTDFSFTTLYDVKLSDDAPAYLINAIILMGEVRNILVSKKTKIEIIKEIKNKIK